MLFLRTLLWRAARHFVADPRIQAKAADIYQREVKPRAQAVGRTARGRLAAGRDELRDIAGDIDPREDHAALLAKVKRPIIYGQDNS